MDDVDVSAFQDGREAFIAGKPRDGRRSKDWLAGYDMEAEACSQR